MRQPLPELETKSPADAAASSAIRDRIAEMERAEQLAQQAAQPPPQASQPQQPEMPAHIHEWLSRHPKYLDPRDPIAQGEIHVATLKCLQYGLKSTADNFLPPIERHLGIAPATNGHAESRHVEHARPVSPAPRPSAPPRMSAPVSAPPHREPPSMSTGRAPSYRMPLN